mgnify:CR=1 FL=1
MEPRTPVSVIPAARLTPLQIDAWAKLQEADSRLASPFCRPEFTQAVAAVCDHIEVAVVEADGAPAGFLPFQRVEPCVAKPVGGCLSDYQGMIARRGLVWDPVELLRDCGLVSFYFDHMVATLESVQPYHYRPAESPLMDLSQGFDAYLKEVNCKAWREMPRRVRKLAREHGPVRLELNCRDAAVRDMLIEWKTAQYKRTNGRNIFEFEWTLGLLETVLAKQSDSFSGQLVALFAGDDLVAAEFGMRSHGTYHSWIGTYNDQFHSASPGLMLLYQLGSCARDHGIDVIDLGKGPEPYKRTIMNGSNWLAEGCIDTRPSASYLKRLLFQARLRVLESPIRVPARTFVRGAARVVPPLRNLLWMR